MREALSIIPTLYWVAFVLLGLAVWVDDWRGILLAAVCMVVGSLQLVRDQMQHTDGD